MNEAGSVAVGTKPRRNHLLDLLRLTFALLVLLGHAPELVDGNQSRELLVRLIHVPMTVGGIAVHGFFLLSGALILRSWLAEPEPGNYLRKRALRIVPGYVVAVALSVLVVGLLAPGVPHFFLQFHRDFWISFFTLNSPITPPVLPGEAYPLANGSLWTITYEVRCYLLVALLGVLGLLRKPYAWVVCTLFFLLAALLPSLFHALYWTKHFGLLGDPQAFYQLFAAFFVGGCFVFFEERVPWRPVLAFAAVLLLWAATNAAATVDVAVTLCGGYLLFYLARLQFSPAFLEDLPDISYGIYLYGWPVEALLVWYLHASPWLIFVFSVPLCVALGWLSWHFVERPALKRKKRATASLPAA